MVMRCPVVDGCAAACAGERNTSFARRGEPECGLESRQVDTLGAPSSDVPVSFTFSASRSKLCPYPLKELSSSSQDVTWWAGTVLGDVWAPGQPEAVQMHRYGVPGVEADVAGRYRRA